MHIFVLFNVAHDKFQFVTFLESRAERLQITIRSEETFFPAFWKELGLKTCGIGLILVAEDILNKIYAKLHAFPNS